MIEKRITARYYNANRVAVGIVAVVNIYDGELFDWAAYIGGTERTQMEEHCVEDVARHGVKLMRRDATHFFPDLPISKYRV